MSTEEKSPIVCDKCQEKELQQVRHELQKCRSSNAAKENEIKKKDKKVFILMCIVVAIGAIFGKEAIDTIGEWMESLGAVKSGVDNLTASIVPGPATLGIFGMGAACLRPRRK